MIIAEMVYNVSNGTLEPIVRYQTSAAFGRCEKLRTLWIGSSQLHRTVSSSVYAKHFSIDISHMSCGLDGWRNIWHLLCLHCRFLLKIHHWFLLHWSRYSFIFGQKWDPLALSVIFGAIRSSLQRYWWRWPVVTIIVSF